MGASRDELETLYRDRYAGFRNALATVTGSYDSAHDAVQEAFARALRYRSSYRGDGSLAGWVWRIALRSALDSRRPHDDPFDALPEASLVDDGQDPELAAAIRALPPRRRLIVFLRYYADLSYEEIAYACDASVGTVSATLVQAHAQLRELLERRESHAR